MKKKLLALVLCIAALGCFALPFLHTDPVNISGFSAAFGYSFMGYSLLEANLLLILAFLLGVAAVVLVFTPMDVLCPLCNGASAVLLLLFAFSAIGPAEAELSALFSAGTVSAGAGLWLGAVLFAAAAAVRLLRRRTASPEDKTVSL